VFTNVWARLSARTHLKIKAAAVLNLAAFTYLDIRGDYRDATIAAAFPLAMYLVLAAAVYASKRRRVG
jgi:hypothetical protein